MHIEVDIWEIVFLIFSYTFFKWMFRGVIVVFVLKVITAIQKKGAEKIEGIKQQFYKKDDSKRDLEN